jgi:4-hydroxy-4-methyl-2-oxoglutarate aldolase
VSAHVVIRDVVRTEASVLAGLAELGVSTVHEADQRRGALDPAIRPIQAGVRIAGAAVTVSCPPGDNLMVHAAVEFLRRGDILVVTTTSPSTDGMIGELLATSMRAHGAVGLVTAASVRDAEELRAMGFPVWARAINPQGTTKTKPGSVNVPVVCGGQLVHPGDAVVADDDGVVVVPRLDCAKVAKAGEEREKKEAGTRARLQKGELGLDVYDMRKALAEKGLKYVDGPLDD